MIFQHSNKLLEEQAHGRYLEKALIFGVHATATFDGFQDIMRQTYIDPPGSWLQYPAGGWEFLL